MRQSKITDFIKEKERQPLDRESDLAAEQQMDTNGEFDLRSELKNVKRRKK